MYSETKPILFNCPKEFDTVEIYPVHDLHYGSEQFNLRKWNALHDLILSSTNRFIVWVGDLLENSVPFSNHSDCLSQMYSPQRRSQQRCSSQGCLSSAGSVPMRTVFPETYL